MSQPTVPRNALSGRHISLWNSHGRYYDMSRKEWRWQRPFLFSTTEDLFTQTIVVPYLIPMLQNAGAIVFTPRERDMQIHEVIVDNDSRHSGYRESGTLGKWHTARTHGFAVSADTIPDGYNPFEHGTVRITPTFPDNNGPSASYQPKLPEAGRYAVYVSYTTEKESIDDVLYSVYHKGRRTDFHVNQQMGGGTWVYLGTFDFDAGSSPANRVVVSSKSKSRGVVTTDAVRFGGGMGNILRGNSVSNMPRFLEGARYYAQWAGAPRKVYSTYDGRNDYNDDINVRSLMTNWLSGGSPYNPDSANINPYDTIYSSVLVHDTLHVTLTDSVAGTSRDTIEIRSRMDTVPTGFRHLIGKKVPFDLSLAIHSDAGFNRDMKSIFGSLAICTTNYNDSLLNAGPSREHSKDFARMLLEGAKHDLSAAFVVDSLSPLSSRLSSITGVWSYRDLYDRNYSETRLPAIPSAILETLSHQSFPDMRMAHDPEFKFALARSIYKTILRYEAQAHGVDSLQQYYPITVQPLAPKEFAIQMTEQGTAVLSWSAQPDTLEATAYPTGYNVYTSVDSLGFDNGTHISQPLYTLQLKPHSLYRFRITATNDGGESFPTEELCAYYNDAKAKKILIVNGFNRLSSPAVVDSVKVDPENPDKKYYYKGFDINDDPGLSYGPTACWSGRQKVFCTVTAGREGPGTFGYSGQELQGHIIAGNDFNYVGEHAESIIGISGIRDLGNLGFNIVSSSRAAVEQGRVDMSHYDCIDLLLGNERDDGHSLHPYKTFTPLLQLKLKTLFSEAMPQSPPALIVSGSYIASDMQSTLEDSLFLADVLHCTLDSTVRTANDTVTAKELNMPLIHTLNPKHYATTRSDVLKPSGEALPLMQYSDGSIAAIAIPRKLVVLGFPIECIEDKNQRTKVMQEFVNLLIR